MMNKLWDYAIDRVERVSGIAVRVAGDRIADLASMVEMPPPLLRSGYAGFEQWLRICKQADQSAPRARIAVHLLRNRMWAEWTTYCCCRLLLMQYEPVLTYSGRETRRFFEQRNVLDPNLKGFWRKVVGNGIFRLVDLDAYRSPNRNEDDNIDEKTLLRARIAIAYDEGVERSENASDVERAAREIVEYTRATERFAEDQGVDRAIVPSGLIGSSPGVLDGFRNAAVPVVTVESWGLRNGHMIWNDNQPALHFALPAWFSELGELTEAQRRLVQSYLAFQENPVREARGHWSLYRSAQKVSIERGLPSALKRFLSDERRIALLGTNVVGDSATLGKETLFNSQTEWLSAVIKWFHEHSDYKLVIRVHPEEGLNRTRLPLGDFVRPRIRDIENIHLVDSETSVNTFALARKAAVGLTWVSNLGVDMAARGVIVIAAARSPYHGSGVAVEPSDSSDYFVKLDRALSANASASTSAVQSAYRHIYTFTRLLSLAGRHNDGGLRYRRLERELSDDSELFFRILVGESNRSDVIRADRRAAETPSE